MLRFFIVSFLIQLGFCVGYGIDEPEIEFRDPSSEISNIVDQPWLPLYSTDPTKRKLMRLEMENRIPMEYLAREEVILAGFSMYEETRARSRRVYAKGVSIVDIQTAEVLQPVGLPEALVILQVQWSPDGENLALIVERTNQTEIWNIDVESGQANKLSGIPIQAGMEEVLYWSSDSRSIILKTVPENLGPKPVKNSVPSGALVRETTGDALPAQTHQGVLRTQLDVDLFEYYFKSQVSRISIDGTVDNIGEPGLYRYVRESPDGNYLLVERLVRPWSYIVNEKQFAYEIEVWDLLSGETQVIAYSRLAEYLPYGGGAVRTGAREFEWRSDQPATVVWVEAQDGGDSYQNVRIREQVYSLSAPFESRPELLAALENRFGDILWHREDQALMITWDWVGRQIEYVSFDPSKPTEKRRKLMDFEMGDRYRNPGYPMMKFNEFGFPVLQTDAQGDYFYLSGDGASIEGDRPFLDRYHFKSKRKKRLFRSTDPYYESPSALLNAEGTELLVKRESTHMPPSFFSWNSDEGFSRKITRDINPFVALKSIKRQQLSYKRKDGVRLTANLYLPPGYDLKEDGPLPTLVWAYPRAYQSASNASQSKRSPYQFIDARWNRPLIWTLKGYAVVDDPTMPIVSTAKGNPNDRFIPQLVDSAEALVEELIERGISQKDQIALGGHSYGAFMTANLLAHTNLFCAGIARSGAYNRTLTPFGFQSEERNFWRAPRVYLAMSPYLVANAIEEPLLLLHGENDLNPGTYLMQSERLFHALNGLGRTARLVILPNEGHTIRGSSSIKHSLWEIETWLDRHVKGVDLDDTAPLVFQNTNSGGTFESVDNGERDSPE